MAERRSEPYLSTYLHSRGGKLGLPVSGNFELTARCNFHCPMCYVHLKQEDIDAAGKELTAGQWIEIARQARDRGMMFALLTGGEPFVRKDFFEIYEAMKNMGIMISINSNGSMIEGAVRERLLENPPFRINISLYGGCPETYRSMCGQDAFSRVYDNIRALKEAGVDVRLNLSITQYNKQDLEKICAAICTPPSVRGQNLAAATVRAPRRQPAAAWNGTFCGSHRRSLPSGPGICRSWSRWNPRNAVRIRRRAWAAGRDTAASG